MRVANARPARVTARSVASAVSAPVNAASAVKATAAVSVATAVNVARVRKKPRCAWTGPNPPAHPCPWRPLAKHPWPKAPQWRSPMAQHRRPVKSSAASAGRAPATAVTAVNVATAPRAKTRQLPQWTPTRRQARFQSQMGLQPSQILRWMLSKR